jgi:hypothetical protein
MNDTHSGTANSQGYISPRVLEDNWKEMFTYLYARHDVFVFPLTIHPQSSGSPFAVSLIQPETQCRAEPHVLQMHKRLVDWLKTHDGVEFVPYEKVCADFKAGLIPEGKITGGVDA